MTNFEYYVGMAKIPIKLEKDTIIEALFEIRFKSETQNLSKILPGILFQKFNGEFTRIEGLPASSVPDEIANKEEPFRYMPFHRLIGDEFLMQVGNSMFSLVCKKPYSGWNRFYEKVNGIMAVLKETGLITNIERFSIKYVNLIPSPKSMGLTPLKLLCKIDGVDIGEESTRLRNEKPISDFIQILEIASPASVVTEAGEKLDGVLVDVDIISNFKFNDFWKEYPDKLQEAHDIEKNTFFKILKANTIDSLGPVYD